MIVTEIYNGQGLGNQLACYVTTRVLALDKGYDFGTMNPHKFKCLDFMDLDFGLPVLGGSGPEGGPPHSLPDGITCYLRETDARTPWNDDIRIDDPRLETVQDGTKLDGVFQSENQIYHRRSEIKQWLAVKPDKDCFEFSSEDICIINFRGGEYTAHPRFFLNAVYWQNAIAEMKRVNPFMEFVVITDDVRTARAFFPDYSCYHFDIGKDYSIIKNAHYLILSNSSFPYFATLCNENVKHILAPKYWGRHNVSDGFWSCGYNIYRNHFYIDRNGKISDYDTCISEFAEYRKTKDWWRAYE
jgi:hypothetical protein